MPTLHLRPPARQAIGPFVIVGARRPVLWGPDGREALPDQLCRVPSQDLPGAGVPDRHPFIQVGGHDGVVAGALQDQPVALVALPVSGLHGQGRLGLGDFPGLAVGGGEVGEHPAQEPAVAGVGPGEGQLRHEGLRPVGAGQDQLGLAAVFQQAREVGRGVGPHECGELGAGQAAGGRADHVGQGPVAIEHVALLADHQRPVGHLLDELAVGAIGGLQRVDPAIVGTAHDDGVHLPVADRLQGLQGLGQLVPKLGNLARLRQRWQLGGQTIFHHRRVRLVPSGPGRAAPARYPTDRR